MSRAACVVVLALLGGCAPIEVTTRTERGPLLRTFHRPSILEGATSATATASWPTLELRVVGTDTCRDEELAEYAEERVTERAAPSAGPSLSTGIAVTLAGAIAFGVSYAVSSAPDTSVMDRAGRFGPSPATLVRGWSLAGLVVGLPALVVGIVGYLQTGEEVKHLKVEQVMGQRDAVCNERPLSGPVALLGARGAVARGEAVEGVVRFDATAVGSPVEEVTFADREVELDGPSLAVLEAFAACGQLELESVQPLEQLTDAALVARAGRLTACRRLRPEVVAPSLEAVQAELSRRRASEAPGAPGSGAPSGVGAEPQR